MKFKIEKVGRISEAIIEPRKLTMFLGKNDSGKTYAASTIWAVINFIRKKKKKRDILGNIPVAHFLNNINGNIREGNFTFSISSQELNDIQRSVIDYLQRNIKKILEDAIGYDGFGASRIDILDQVHLHPLNLTFSVKEVRNAEEVITADLDDTEIEESEQSKDIFHSVEGVLETSDGIFYKMSVESPDSSIILEFIARAMSERILGYACFGKRWAKFRNAVYLPAARTGIMLALSYFVESAVRQGEFPLDEVKAERSGLPAPIRNFAARMTSPAPDRVQRRIASLHRIIKGDLNRGKRKGLFFYTPEGGKTQIPLASTSSLITETAPLSLLRPDQIRSMFLIFEEPEAHLHLEAQRDMARALAYLVNNGAEMLITTHSDTFIQQLNNLIAVSDHPHRQSLMEQLELSDDDVLARDSVCAYDFVCRDGSTRAQELEMTRTGFVAESLNDVLRKLAAETILIDEGLYQSDDEISY